MASVVASAFWCHKLFSAGLTMRCYYCMRSIKARSHRHRETRNEERETRNEKRETRNEKRETRNRTERSHRHRETRNEKRQRRSVVRSLLTAISTPICQISPFSRASLTLYSAADLSYSTWLVWTSRISLSAPLASMTACRRRWCLRYWTSRWFVNIFFGGKKSVDCRSWKSSSFLVPRNKIGELLIFDWTTVFSFLVSRWRCDRAFSLWISIQLDS